MTQKNLLEEYKYIYIPEVVRNQNMHYWNVPRLGSYIAIPLVVKSCFSVSSFKKAVFDYNFYQT